MKCSKHNEGCSWTGSVVDFQLHLDKCVGADKANLVRNGDISATNI